MQYINDGIETEEYFPAGSPNVSAQEELVGENNTTRFVIKQAADGSVYLIEVTSTSSNIASILNANTTSVVDATYKASIDECNILLRLLFMHGLSLQLRVVNKIGY